MTRYWVLRAMLLAVAAGAFAAPARAQGGDPSAAAYCEPAPQTKLLYSNRGYLILPKPADAPPLAYSYAILGTERRVERPRSRPRLQDTRCRQS